MLSGVFLIHIRTLTGDTVLDGNSNNGLVLVATGSLASVDPDRITLKKVCTCSCTCLYFCTYQAIDSHIYSGYNIRLQIILTGIPVRVRKRMAVVKQMFHDPEVSECCLGNTYYELFIVYVNTYSCVHVLLSTALVFGTYRQFAIYYISYF